MLQVDKNYKLKDNQEIYLVDIVDGYFSEEKFAVIRDDRKTYITSLLELEAKIDTGTYKKLRSTQEKIDLYRSYFRGNEAVVATSFKNDQGKMVYFPWCHIRKKFPCPKVKNPKFQCSNCNLHQFQSFDDKVIFNHLRGFDQKRREVLYGVYPILEDNSVYFLAIDFDKGNWKKDVNAFVKVLKSLNISPLVEISQSGNGSHVWLFFKSNISAKIARDLGKQLLRRTMMDNPKMDFHSFDRMFPNQDELSGGGFGNLIALPLQGGRVQKGFSRFVDENFSLIEDVWTAIESTPKLSLNFVQQTISELNSDLPVEFYKTTDDEKMTIFDYADGDSLKSQTQIDITINTNIVIELSQLTSKEVVQLKHLSSFHNKAFYIAQKKRLNTYDIPRIISLAEVDDRYLYLPRGLENKIMEKFPNANIIDNKDQGKRINVDFIGQLYPEQQEGLNKLLDNEMGILCAGTGFGKTIVAGKLIAEKKVNCLILVHTKNLAGQWKAQLEEFLDIKDEPFEELTPKGRKRKKDKIGKIYEGKILRSGNIDIALFQSLSKNEDIDEIMKEYGMVIVDEAHHVAAKTFEDVIKCAGSKYIYGLTATPQREDGLENILYMQLGEIKHKADKIIPRHIIQQLYIRFTSLGEHISNIETNELHDNNELIIQSEDRNNQIVQDIKDNILEKRHIIVLSRYVEHINKLKEKLDKEKINAPIYILNSKMRSKDIKNELMNLKNEGKPFVLLTTGSYAGEGFDLPSLDTLILAMPNSGKNVMQQYLGRLLRGLDEKEKLKVYDYVDYAIPMIYRMYQKRLRAYKQLGYEIYQDELTDLYKSNIFEGEYEDLVIGDLNKTESSFTVISPHMTKSMMLALDSIRNDCDKTLIISSRVKNKFKDDIDRLISSGYKVLVKNNIQQYFVVIDNKIVWMLPNLYQSSEDMISLRMYSEEIAKKLTSFVK